MVRTRMRRSMRSGCRHCVLVMPKPLDLPSEHRGSMPPAPAVIEHPPFRRRLRHSDDPRLWMALFLKNADMGFHFAFPQTDVLQHSECCLRCFSGGQFATRMRKKQGFPQPQAVAPALLLAPAEQRRRAVETVAPQEKGGTFRQQGKSRLQPGLLPLKAKAKSAHTAIGQFAIRTIYRSCSISIVRSL